MIRLALAIGFLAVFGFVTMWIINKIAENLNKKTKENASNCSSSDKEKEQSDKPTT